MKKKRIQKKNDEVKLVLGVCWYAPVEFIKMKQAAVDGDNFENTYEEWRQFAEKTITNLKKEGVDPQKVYLKTDDFKFWCEKNDLPADGPARTRYVNEILESENNSKE